MDAIKEWLAIILAAVSGVAWLVRWRTDSLAATRCLSHKEGH